MSLTVLSDEQISDLLHNVNEAELDGLRTVLAEALHEYSTGTPEIATCCQNQPVRQMIASQGGKTLFMVCLTSTISPLASPHRSLKNILF